ncbi:MAG: hypothetical protein IJR90_01235 [Clostridia bacterium]|nr:hypothetical protein [Clostridia bacterium]
MKFRLFLKRHKFAIEFDVIILALILFFTYVLITSIDVKNGRLNEYTGKIVSYAETRGKHTEFFLLGLENGDYVKASSTDSTKPIGEDLQQSFDNKDTVTVRYTRQFSLFSFKYHTVISLTCGGEEIICVEETTEREIAYGNIAKGIIVFCIVALVAQILIVLIVKGKIRIKYKKKKE